MTKTVNEHLLTNIRALKEAHGAYASDKWSNVPKYKRFNKRINFLLGVNQSHGRNKLLTMTEVSDRKVNPIVL